MKRLFAFLLAALLLMPTASAREIQPDHAVSPWAPEAVRPMNDLGVMTGSAFGIVFRILDAAFAQADQNTDEFDYSHAYHWALDVGFSEGFLAGMSETALKQVYDDHIDAEELIVEEEVQAGSATETHGNISTSHMRLRTVTATKVTNGTITSVSVYVTAAWNNGRPLTRLTDTFTSNWNASIWHFEEESFWGTIEEVHNLGGATHTVYSVAVAARQEQGVLSWYIPLEKTVLGYTPTVRIGYQLVPKNTDMPNGTRYSSPIISTYDHQHPGSQPTSIIISTVTHG